MRKVQWLVAGCVAAVVLALVLLNQSLREDRGPLSGRYPHPSASQPVVTPTADDRMTPDQQHSQAPLGDLPEQAPDVAPPMDWRTAFRELIERTQARMRLDNPGPIRSSDIPPENGMHYFLLASELADVDPNSLRWDEWAASGWTDPEFLRLLEALRPAFEAVRMGLLAGNAIMPLTRNGFNENIDYLQQWRQLARFMTAEAQLLLAEGDVDAAVDNLGTVLNFANQSSQGGVIITGLINFAMANEAAEIIRHVFADGLISGPAGRVLVDQLAAWELTAPTASEIVLGEAAHLHSWFEAQITAGASPRDTMLAASRGNPEFARALEAMSDSEFEQYLLGFIQDYEAAVAFDQLPYYEVHGMDAAARFRESPNPLTRFLLPSFEATLAAETRARAELRGTVLAAGLELYRADTDAYPESLDQLVPAYAPAAPEDPFTGRPFVYRPTGAGYTLYSAGPDMRDDGGNPAQDWREPGSDLVLRKRGEAAVARASAVS